jgi:shikimate dehydrogenase
LEHASLDVDGKKVLVLGSGGSSNSVCCVLRDKGAEPVVISRNGENNYENLSRHADAKMVVNTTPVGMFPHTEEAPLSLDGLPACEAVVDIIYNPLRTRLILNAQKRGIKAEGGL